MLGRTVWDVQHKFRIVMGPLAWERFATLLPDGKPLEQLRALVRQYVGFEFAWDLRLILKGDDVPSWTLAGGRDRRTGRLGRTAWLKGSRNSRRTADADELIMNVESIRLGSDRDGRRGGMNRAPGSGKSRDREERGMSEISRVSLFGKLNPLVYKTIEGATVFCKLRGNPYVELVHWMTQLLENNASDVHAIVRHYALDAAALARDVTAALDRLPRGSTALSDFSEHIPDAIERAWVYGSLQFGDGAVRSAYLLLGMLKTPHLRNALLGISKEFGKIKVDDFADELASIVGKTGEQGLGPQDGSGLSGGQPGEVSGAMAPAAMGKQEAIKKYTIDLTAKAAEGRDGSGHRPRRRDPPDRRHPDAPPPEQPDPHRRGRRRQDRGGRGLRAAAGARRRAAAAAGRVAALARPRPAPGRRVDEGRVRAAPAPADRRGAGQPEADHPVHRRGPHAGRRRRRRRHRRRRQPAQAGAGARHAAHDRRDDLGRVQEAHREGPGADPALPGRAGRPSPTS